MKTDIDTLTIIDDETIRMEAHPPRQEVDRGREKLERLGWEVIESPSESREDGEKWILEKNSYPIGHQITVDSRNAMGGIRFTHNLKEKNILDGRLVKPVTSVNGAMRCDITRNEIYCVSDAPDGEQSASGQSPYPSFDKFCETIWTGLKEHHFFIIINSLNHSICVCNMCQKMDKNMVFFPPFNEWFCINCYNNFHEDWLESIKKQEK